MMRGRILLTGVIVTALAGFTAAASVASFTAETTNPTNKFATGTLVLSNKVNSGTVCLSTGGGSTDTNANGACDSLLVGTLQPGQSGSTDLTLKNEGSIAASALTVYSGACTNADATGETYHGTGSPCGQLQLTIQRYSDAGRTTPSECVYGGGTATTCAFSSGKTFTDFVTNYGSAGTAKTIGSGLTSGTTAYFTIAVQMPSAAGNSYQGRAATIDLTWHLDQ
jgi:hypothetical protein